MGTQTTDHILGINGKIGRIIFGDEK